MTGTGRAEWRGAKLEDLVFFQRGFDITQEQQRDGAYPVVSSSGVTSHHDEFMVKGPGVVIGRKGTLGSIHYVPEDYWPHDTTLWSKDFRGNNPRFVYYFLHTINFKHFDVGNSNPTLNRNHIHDLRIRMPSPAVQGTIADALAAYDDLIENNTRRIALLEQAARLLYEEWFVRLRFPGHERVDLTETPLGRLPQDWRIVMLQDICSRVGDGAHHSPASVDAGLPMASMKDMDDWGFTLSTCRRISEDDFGELVRMGYKPQVGDVLVAKDGVNYLKFAFVLHKPTEVVLLSSIALLRPSPDVEPCFLRYAMDDPRNKGRLANQVSGVAIPRIIVRDFARFKIAVPPKPLQDAWWTTVKPLVAMIHCLRETTGRLGHARDLLLPRLMSGEIEV